MTLVYSTSAAVLARIHNNRLASALLRNSPEPAAFGAHVIRSEIKGPVK